jgi:hypothetical protein
MMFRYYTRPGRKFLLLERNGILKEITVISSDGERIVYKESTIGSMWCDTEHQSLQVFKNAYKEHRLFRYPKALKKRDTLEHLKEG